MQAKEVKLPLQVKGREVFTHELNLCGATFKFVFSPTMLDCFSGTLGHLRQAPEPQAEL